MEPLAQTARAEFLELALLDIPLPLSLSPPLTCDYVLSLVLSLVRQKSSRHGLDQKDVAKLGAAHTGFGAYSSFIAGLLYDSLERRHHVGPRLTLLIGCVISSIGFYSLYLGVAQASGPLPFSALAALAVLAGNGCTWFDVSPMSTNLRNFPTGRGSVVGIIKSCIGLCGGLYSIVFYQGLCGGSAEAFLKFLSYGPSLVVLACIPFVNYVPWVQESERVDHVNVQRFMIAIWLIALLTGYVLFVSLVGGLLDVTVHMQRVFAAGAVILLLPLGGIVWDSGGLFAERANVVAGVDGMDGVEVGLLLADDDAFDDMGSAPTEEDENEEDEEDETTRYVCWATMQTLSRALTRACTHALCRS